MSLRFSALCAVALGAGCLAVDGIDAPTSDVAQPLLDCDEYMCGTNSPQIAELGFWDLQVPPTLGTPGAPNNMGIQVLFFAKLGVAYLPRVIGGKLYAYPPAAGAPLSGANLAGGVFFLQRVTSAGTRYFQLKVSEVGRVASWAQPPAGGQVMLESYKLDWTELVNGNWGDFRNMCKHPPARTNPDALGMVSTAAYQTLLFEGDRILAAEKRDVGVDNSWFNLGCAGSTLAKMALTGHTQGARNAGTFNTSLDERQTMLKMLTADLCGKGKPYTVGGQWLNWADDHATMKMLSLIQSPPQPVAFEARWRSTGPACLTKPRVDAHPTADATTLFGLTPSVYEQAKADCPDSFPPPCANIDVTALGGYHLVSATPL